ncbi:transketolase family protein [Candidatus Micrarchaeota archaeon]|nr:transketolase family protein [Candidatus Micrarchaeota archaeon]
MVKKATRDGFGKGLVELTEQNPNIWALSADVSESSRTHWFAEKFPDRFVQVGVAEQNMAGAGAGIAACGKTVFISSFGAFSPGRNFDQIRVCVCYNKVNVKIHGSHTGVSVGPDGASHEILEDLAMMRALPDMIVIAPADMEEAKKATLEVGKLFGPAYIRTSRENSALFTTPQTPFKIGKANVYRDGSDLAIFACGLQVYEALKAAEELKKPENGALDVAVIGCHTIKPIDKETIVKYAKKCEILMSAEDHQVDGGLGSAIAEVLCSVYPAPLYRHGMYRRFAESGNCSDLYKKYELDAAGIVKHAKLAMKLKK